MMRSRLFTLLLLLFPFSQYAQDTYHSNLQSTLQNDFSLPEATYVFFDNESDILNAAQHYENISSVESQAGQDFSMKVRIVIEEAQSQSFDSGWFIRNKAAIQQGNSLLAVFYARSESNSGKVSFFIEDAQSFNKEVFFTMPVDSTWRKYFVPFSAMKSYEAEALSMGFHLGFQEQTIEVGGFTLLNYASSVGVDKLPNQINNELYEGWEADAPWRKEAEDRIDELRKVNLKVETRDSNGLILENAGVQVKMIQHEFAFGSAINANLIAGNNAQNNTYQRKLLNLDDRGHGFNWVVFENDLKWPAWEAEWFVNKTELSKAINWLVRHDIKLRGHTLLWPGINNMPNDIGANIDNLSHIKSRVNGHLESILQHPAIMGNVQEWDVLNEITTNTDLETAFSNSPGYPSGREFYAEVLQKAREEDPNIGLWVNDYVTISLQQVAGFEQYDSLKLKIQELLDAEVDLEGIGFQSHIGGYPNGIPDVLNTLTDFHNSFGLKAKITEFDMPSFVKESLGADYLRDYLTATFSHPSVNGFLFWNFWDGATYMNDGANLFRRDWTVTPAGQAYFDLVFDQWWTDEIIYSNTSGLAETRAFKGQYEISYRCGETTVRDTLNLLADTTLSIVCDNFTTGLDPVNRLDVKVSPNPSHGLFQLTSLDASFSEIKVLDLNGRTVFQKNSSKGNLNLDLRHLSSGIYLLHIDTDTGWFRDKLLIK